MTLNNIFILPGNCRTFIDCIDSCYDHVISKLFQGIESNNYLYLYLKLNDPGPKGQEGWNFSYNDIDNNKLIEKINELKQKYNLNIDYKIINDNEITDDELFKQIKDRSKYVHHYEKDNILLRGLHCHYNFECCGKYIQEKEKLIDIKFDNIIYIRPDLYFTEDCEVITNYSNELITIAEGPTSYNIDHLAIIPRNHFDSFFFDRINLYRNNDKIYFESPEHVYIYTIKFTIKKIGTYFIKR